VTALHFPKVIAAITNQQPAAIPRSTWQIVFVSLAAVILLLEIIHGWRLGLLRQLVRVIAIIVAYSCGFFAANATVPPLRANLRLPDPVLAAIGGTILAFILFAVINGIGAFLFKKTAQQASAATRLVWGVSGALLGVMLGLFTLWLIFAGIRLVGSVAQAQLHAPNPPLASPHSSGMAAPAPSVSPCNPLMSMLADMKNSLEAGHVGDAMRTVDPVPPAVYRDLEKAGAVAANPERAERFLSFPGAREITEHPKVVALRNDRQVMELIGRGQVFELIKNQRMIDALNDPSLQTRIKNFDVERALDYALQKNSSR